MDKRITTLTIKGLNTSMPDLTVPDGACEKLMNMRFRDGSWRNVGAVQMTENIPLPAEVVSRRNHFEFLGVHEVEGVNHYLGKGVIESEDDAGKVYDDLHLYAYVNGEWADLGMFASFSANATSVTEALSTDIRVTSFGNVLIVQCESKLSYFIWSDGSYRLFTMPRPVSIYENTTHFSNENMASIEADATDDDNNNWWFLMNEDGDIMRPVGDERNNLWWGEICYLVAYKMKDGTTLSPSPLRILCSETNTSGVTSLELRLKLFEDKSFYAIKPNVKVSVVKQLRMFRPKLLIKIPEGIDTSLVDKVAIYSTRINSIVDYERILKEYHLSSKSKKYSDFYADNELPNQPLYLVDEIQISKLSNNSWIVELGYDKLKDIVTSPKTFTPLQLHSIFADSIYDYNHRVHYGNITSTLYSHHSATIPQTNNLYKEFIEVEEVGSVLSYPISHIPLTEAEDAEYGTPITTSGQVHLVTPILSYPDYRASSVRFVREDMDEISEWKKLLKAAIANNVAYYITPTNGIVKYPQEGIVIDRSVDSIPINPTFSEPNRIQVSAPNNPFSLPFQNSYAVGNEGSRVVAMNTVADSLVDSNFYGAYPLYIFTADGIFALRAGSGEVLYAGTEIINHDKINNPRTIALNGSVVYACSEGLKALTGRQAVRISADIDPLTWAEAQFGINWEYGELLCRMANGEVFVWNIAAGAWSQRNDVVGSLRGGYAGEVTSKGMLVVCDINKEDIEETEVMLVTRPLKFDSIGFKKLDTLIARIASSLPCNWTIKVESSNDCREWRVIKNVVVEENLADIGLRRFSQSARFYRITISGTIKRIVPITQIDIQLQDRYNNKLR